MSISKIGANLHDWSFVRAKLRAIVADSPVLPAVRIELARELGRAGLPELARTVLANIDLTEPEVVHLSIEALSACCGTDEGLQLCRTHSMRTDIDLLDRVEVARQAGRCGRNDVARSLLTEAAGRDNANVSGCSRAAELLADMGYQTDARTILFALQEKALRCANLDADEMLWLVDAMMSCDLPISARAVLDRVSRRDVSEHSLDRYDELNASLREPLYALAGL